MYCFFFALKMKFVTYAMASSIACVAIMVHGYLEFHQFYPTCVHILNSSASLLVLYNACLMLTVSLAKVFQQILFGNLRSIELEHVYERSWYTITETCLAMTIFRDEFNVNFIIHFTSLLICKVYHWIVQDRIDYVEQTPLVSRWFHLRLGSVIFLLAMVDIWFIRLYVNQVIRSGPSMMIFFGFEYLVLAILIYSLLIKYALYRFDQLNETPWENKSTYIFYLELVTDFCRLIIYMTFFSTVFFYYGLPLHIIRDLYLTFRSFTMRVRDVVQYRRATANMQERYPNATEEELMAIDRTCIICREEMTVGRKLPCGHIFHFHCLRSWLERQQICPTCRTSVLQSRPQERVVPASQSVPAGSPGDRDERRAVNHLAETGARTVTSREAIVNPREQSPLPGSFAIWVPASQALSSSQYPSASRTIHFPSATSSPSFRWPSTGLDEETLKRMEGDQRHHLEERLKFLASLQDHLSDLIVQITQYLDLTSTKEVSSSNDTSSPSSSGIERNHIKSSDSMSETTPSETNAASSSSPS